MALNEVRLLRHVLLHVAPAVFLDDGVEFLDDGVEGIERRVVVGGIRGHEFAGKLRLQEIERRRVHHSCCRYARARPTRSSRLDGAAAARRRRRFHFTNYGSERRWSSGGRGDRRCRTMMMSASPGRGGGGRCWPWWTPTS